MRYRIVAAGFAMLSQAAAAQGLPVERYLPLDVAIAAASAALAQCKADGHAVSVEVMNHNARVLVTYHDPFTTIHSAYSAHAKAYTLLSYSRASGETTSAQIASRITKNPGGCRPHPGNSRTDPRSWRGAYQIQRSDRRGDWGRRLNRVHPGRKMRIRGDRENPVDSGCEIGAQDIERALGRVPGPLFCVSEQREHDPQ